MVLPLRLLLLLLLLLPLLLPYRCYSRYYCDYCDYCDCYCSTRSTTRSSHGRDAATPSATRISTGYRPPAAGGKRCGALC
ncbi:MAG: hypothetical protein M1832_005242 [Thelocarpon impressellum]|nr:MAG: hypothetical protein M1832_005242 [Thelocarpon impressellum]